MTQSPHTIELAFERFLAELAVECLSKPEDREDWAAIVEEHLAAKARELAKARPLDERKPREPGKPRRPSISKMIKQTEQAGKPLATITLPDGTKLDFNKPEPAESENPWPLDEFRTKETKQ